MTTQAINRSNAQLPVEIEFPEQPARPHDIVFIQPKSRANLPPKSRVTEAFRTLNAKVLVLYQVDDANEPVAP